MQVIRQFVLLLVFFLFQVNFFGQEKETLTESDYQRWYHFHQTTLSADGKWIAYSVQNPKGKDTMVLRMTDSAYKQITIGGTQGSFSPKSDWFAFVRDQQLYLQFLRTGQRDSIQGIDSYFFSKGGTHLIAGRKKQGELTLLNLGTKHLQVIPSVESYELSTDSTQLAFIQNSDGKKRVCILPFTKTKKVFELAHFTENISGLTWNTKGNGLAFFESFPLEYSATDHQLHYLTFETKRLPNVIHRQNSLQMAIPYRVPLSRLFFSLDDEQLFFDVMPLHGSRKENSVAIWAAGSNVLPPPDETPKLQQYLMCWHLKTNRYGLLNDEEFVAIVPTATGKHALRVESSAYLPHFEHKGIYADLYIVDLRTGKKKLIAQKIHNQKNHISLSPQGNYLTWFADRNWWIYDIFLDKTRCLTCSLSASFENWEHDYPGSKYPNDKPYWSSGDHHLLLSDYYDLWLFSPNGKLKKRLTEGHLSKSRFRLHDEQFTKMVRDYFILYTTRSYDFKKGLVFKEVNTQTLEEGFSFYQLDGSSRPIFYSSDKISSIYKGGDVVVFVLSDFDRSPELMVQHVGKDKTEIIQSSNVHQKEYHWGKSELIHYKANGSSLKGALFYPANYQSNTTYPMVVKVYERNSSLLRKYITPTMENHIGFNITNYTHAGYFVLLPDISYTINRPGASALECVLAAVNKVVATVAVDSNNIGLLGHSFGGFEVSYIATQSQRFKTIVSGSGWHDLIGTYLGTDDSGSSNMWRFDTQQIRITEPYYARGFWENSPVMQAHQIDTPMLLWTGTEDLRVNWRNSVTMQFALWRLGKESTLLLYDKEGHVLNDPSNQKDLTIKTMEWFDYYLKGNKKPEWITKKRGF